MNKYNDSELALLELDILEFFSYKYNVPKSPLFDNEIYYPFYYSLKRYFHAYGGRGGGKSEDMIGKYVTVHLSCLPFCRIVGVRQVFNSIRGSMFQEILDYITKWKLNEFFKITKSPMEIVHIESGNFMKFAGMDKPDSIKSIKDPTHVLFEEAYQIKNEKGIHKIDDSVRTPKIPYNKQKMIFVYNPDNKDHFLYKNFFDPDTEHQFEEVRKDSLIIKSTYRDNKFLTKEVGQRYERIKKTDPDRYKVDVLGEWGTLKIQGAYYSAFNYDKTVKRNLFSEKYDRSLPLDITFDFNVDPYISLVINQIYFNELTNTLEFCAIDEICITKPAEMGIIDFTIKAFLAKYHNHIGDVRVHGDRSGHSRKTTGKTDFATVFNMLRPTLNNQMIRGKNEQIDPYPEYVALKCKFRLVDLTLKTQNPSLKVRQVLFKRLHAGQLSVLKLGEGKTINAAGQKRPFSRQYGGCQVVQLIDQDNCPMLIKDYMEVVEDIVKGGKSSKDHNLTHASDSQDYVVCSILDAEFEAIKIELKT